MSSGTWWPDTQADWLAFAASLLFVALGLILLVRHETAVLRLAIWGWPAWPVKAVAIANVVGGAMLLARSTRIVGAIFLAALSAAQLVAHILYREPDLVFEAGCQLILMVGVLLLEHNRIRGNAGEGADQS